VPSDTPDRSRLPRVALASFLVIALAACQGAPASEGDGATIDVSVSAAGCAPTTVTAAAGQVLFVVTNAGTDPAEFEVIGSDQRVIDEAENIFPGFVVNLKSRLDGGTYELVCGTLSAPRGTLTVSGGAAPTRPPSTLVEQATIDAAVAEYKTYVLGESDALITVIDTFTTAVDEGDLEAAKAAYGPSRVPWERIEPIAELFADLDPKIDAREDDYQAGVDDPEFTGYHKIEYLLYTLGTTDGTAELTAGLRANVAELRTKLETLVIDPRVMTQGAGVLIDEVAQSKMTGEEDRYSRLDLWSIDPNLEGSARIVDILRPTLETVDTDYLKELDDAYAAVTSIIDKYGDQAAGFKTFDQVSDADRKAMQAGLAKLSELLSELSGRLGLEA
jgi:iron uptake system component EfeO